MAEWVTRLVGGWGYWGIGLLMFLENIFPPIPSEVIMPLAGFASSDGRLSLWGVCVAGTLGSVAGQVPLYYLGRAWGEARFRRFVERYGRWMLLDVGDVDRAGQWFDRHGMGAVFLCRLVPGVRSLISIPAGIRRMPLLPFLGFSGLGMGIWATALAAIGRLLGRNYERVEAYIGPVTYVVLGGLVVALVVRAIRRRRRDANTSAARERV